MTLTLVIADDQRIVRQGLRALLALVPDLSVIGEAADGKAAVRLVERLSPDVLVLDLIVPRPGGLEVARRLAGRSLRTRIVILSTHADEAYVAEAMRAGAAAYVLKDAGVEELTHAIREAAAGRRFLSPHLSARAHEMLNQKAETALDPFPTLTHREREVLRLTTEGNSGAAVAKLLFISPRTVESHRASVMRKLGVRNQKELVRFATERLLPAPVWPAEDEKTRTRRENQNQ